MKIGINITTYNRKRFTEECLKSIIWSKPLHTKIVIVDNASTDGTIEVLKKFHKDYPDLIEKVIFNDKNYHLGYAWTQGWSYLKESCDILCSINNDFLLDPGWEENALACFSELDLDYIVGTVRPDRENQKKKTPSGIGQYTSINDVGAGYFVLTKHFVENNFSLSLKPFSEKYAGPGSGFHKSMQKNKLKGIRLAHPGVLVRDSEYNHPNYIDYYNKTFGERSIQGKLEKWRKQEKKIGKRVRGVINWKEFIFKYYPEKAKEELKI